MELGMGGPIDKEIKEEFGGGKVEGIPKSVSRNLRGS
jgi:hypothetical protein